MAISSVLVVDLYTGFTATVWTWWLTFAVAFGLVVQWCFTVRAHPLAFVCVLQNGLRRSSTRHWGLTPRPLAIFMETTTSFSDRPTSGYHYPSPSLLRLLLGISTKAGNSSIIQETSRPSSSCKRSTLVEICRLSRRQSRRMAQQDHGRYRQPGDAIHAQAVPCPWSPTGLGGRRAIYARRTGRTWRQALRLWTVDSILRQRRMGLRCAACRRIYQRGGCLNSICRVAAKERMQLKTSFLCQGASCGRRYRLHHDML